ncbi:Rhodanese-like protein [Thalassoporum mexicanum PCC 7367]|uniref:rhodanese-like domain-containing protein n=1 Tax=Thalassoporum mexicanum TaxID=3457544 RepID=UPI00029FF8DA|nr:rhodanese-like domain-containing protein [Pseudanabaena sp. PCC 7367]AFY70131.1 Rhodanese-like protein [Pseudanabaena sp. PCC 7367]
MSYAEQPPAIPQIHVDQLADLIAAADPSLQLIDVREPDEIAIAHVAGFTFLPLSQFAEWSGQVAKKLDPNALTLVMCHHGMRSQQMCQWLARQGFSNVKNVIGGIDAYSIAVDRTIPRY